MEIKIMFSIYGEPYKIECSTIVDTTSTIDDIAARVQTYRTQYFAQALVRAEPEEADAFKTAALNHRTICVEFNLNVHACFL